MIFVIVIDLQHPAVFIAFKSQHKRLVKVDAGSIARSSHQFLGDVFEDSPSGDDIILNVNQNVKRFIQAASFVDNFKWFFAFLQLVLILTRYDKILKAYL